MAAPKIRLNIGGTVVDTSMETINASGSAMLKKRAVAVAGSDEEVFVDGDARHLLPLLNYARAVARAVEAPTFRGHARRSPWEHDDPTSPA